jgi:predicted 2-oxoglutarate/Fe(II)-dependent dioxygenase YbiX
MGHEEGKVRSVLDGQDHERVNFEGKRRLDHYIQDQALIRELSMRVLRRLAPEIEKAYRFEGFRLDPFLIGCYQAERKDFFRPHRDNLAPANANRMFAVSINLNAEEYEGGDLRFPEYGPHLYRPETGAALVFSCSLIHEALPVIKGRRFVLLNFMRDVRPPGSPRPTRPAGGA